MKHHRLAPLFWFIALILLIGLACTVPTSQPNNPPDSPPVDPGGGDPLPDQPPADPNQPPPDQPSADPDSDAPSPDQPPADPNQPPPDLPPASAGMVAIPAGNFQMGCAPDDYYDCTEIGGNELPLHTVYLDGYYIDIHEVTNGQYAQCVAAGACELPYFGHDLAGNLFFSDRRYDDPQYANWPVAQIFWADADNYCTWAGKNLPTEAQWEKAARGSSDTRTWPWGNTFPDCSLANMNTDNNAPEGYCAPNLEGSRTAAVGSFPQGASPYGVMDMAGNVAEYVADNYNGGVYSLFEPDAWPANPIFEGPDFAARKGLHGGGWQFGADGLRVSYRGFVKLDERQWWWGFRCAISTAPNTQLTEPVP